MEAVREYEAGAEGVEQVQVKTPSGRVLIEPGEKLTVRLEV